MENPIKKLLSLLPEPRIGAVGKTYKYRLVCKPIRHVLMPNAVSGYRHFLEKAAYGINLRSPVFWTKWKEVLETDLYPQAGIPEKPVSFSSVHDGTVFIQHLIEKENAMAVHYFK